MQAEMGRVVVGSVSNGSGSGGVGNGGGVSGDGNVVDVRGWWLVVVEVGVGLGWS